MLIKTVVTHWRSTDILIAVHFDDGLVVISKCGLKKITLKYGKGSRHTYENRFAGIVYNDKRII